MNNTLKKIVGVLAVLVVLVMGYMLTTGPKSYVGGNFNPVMVDFAQGISVNGTTVLNNLRGLIATTLNVSASTTVSTFTQGGGITATTTLGTTSTLLATAFDTENVIEAIPGGASWTITLPASSTLSTFIPTAGQARSIYIRNATTTAGINMTIAGGTGTVLRSASTTAIIQSDTAGAKGARLDFVRQNNTDISVFITTFNN